LCARVRAGCGWRDVRILNVSSRGMQIDSSLAAIQGNTIELWHGEHVILAEVVWRKGSRAGLRSEQRVPVEDIVTSSRAPELQIVAGQSFERRRKPRTGDQSRHRSRVFEFASVVAIGGLVAAGAVTMVEQAFAKPLAFVEAALAG
jgi:hypothetical protein